MALRVVIDTNVYISAIFWGGKPRQIVDMGRDGHIFIFTSLDIEKEIADKLAVKFHLAEEEISRIMSDFGTFTIPIEPTKKISFIKDDPDDDKFLECGIACQANFIVSGDSHLQRAKKFEGIKILSPSDFLATIQSEE